MTDDSLIRRSHEVVFGEAKFPRATALAHLFVGGSGLHGAKLSEKSDLDLCGVYLEAPNKALGITEFLPTTDNTKKAETPEHFIWSTGGDKRRNNADDVDLNLYGLRKWANMAAKNNPTALCFLFAPNISPSYEAARIWNKW